MEKSYETFVTDLRKLLLAAMDLKEEEIYFSNDGEKYEVLIIGGTSLAVYPAAGLIDYFRGNHLVVINKAPTPRDKYADLLIKEPIGQVFSQIRV